MIQIKKTTYKIWTSYDVIKMMLFLPKIGRNVTMLTSSTQSFPKEFGKQQPTCQI